MPGRARRLQARPPFVLDNTFDLFCALNATDEQCEFPVVYARCAEPACCPACRCPAPFPCMLMPSKARRLPAPHCTACCYSARPCGHWGQRQRQLMRRPPRGAPCSGVNGIAGYSAEDLKADLEPLFETIVKEVRPWPPPFTFTSGPPPGRHLLAEGKAGPGRERCLLCGEKGPSGRREAAGGGADGGGGGRARRCRRPRWTPRRRCRCW